VALVLAALAEAAAKASAVAAASGSRRRLMRETVERTAVSLQQY